MRGISNLKVYFEPFAFYLLPRPGQHIFRVVNPDNVCPLSCQFNGVIPCTAANVKDSFPWFQLEHGEYKLLFDPVGEVTERGFIPGIIVFGVPGGHKIKNLSFRYKFYTVSFVKNNTLPSIPPCSHSAFRRIRSSAPRK